MFSRVAVEPVRKKRFSLYVTNRFMSCTVKCTTARIQVLYLTRFYYNLVVTTLERAAKQIGFNTTSRLQRTVQIWLIADKLVLRMTLMKTSALMS